MTMSESEKNETSQKTKVIVAIVATILLAIGIGIAIAISGESPAKVQAAKAEQVAEPVAAQCHSKFKIGSLVEMIQGGWKGQVITINTHVDPANNACVVSLVFYSDDGIRSTERFWEFELK